MTVPSCLLRHAVNTMKLHPASWKCTHEELEQLAEAALGNWMVSCYLPKSDLEIALETRAEMAARFDDIARAER